MLATVPSSHIYVVKPGDSLWAISAELFGQGREWPWLYAANEKIIGRDPDYLIPGERIEAVLGKHAAYGTIAVPSSGLYYPKHSSDLTVVAKTQAVPVTSSGIYTCAGLESLWTGAGGAPGVAFLAAEVAEAESGGNPDAISPTDDWGLWQINASWGPVLATLNPQANAAAAVKISRDGTDWTPWTTYTDGAYAGRCS